VALKHVDKKENHCLQCSFNLGTVDFNCELKPGFFFSLLKHVLFVMPSLTTVICSLDTKYSFTFIVFCILVMYFGLFPFLMFIMMHFFTRIVGTKMMMNII